MSLKNTLSIAAITIEENLRKKILYLLFFLCLVLVLASKFINVLGVKAPLRLILDLSLTGIGFFGILFTISLILSLIPNEIEHKTIYPILSQPVTRGAYLWGKYLGVMAIVLINLVILTAELIYLVYPYLGYVDVAIIKAVALIFVECGILGSMLLWFTLFTSTPLALTASLFIYIVGNLSHLYVDFLVGSNQVARLAAKILLGILPEFDLMHIKDSVVHSYLIDPAYVPTAAAYGLLYIVIFMLLSEMVLLKKDL